MRWRFVPWEIKYHISLDIIIISLDRLMAVVDTIDMVGLLGGEPFLYSYLVNVVVYLCKQNKVTGIRIVTN